MSAAPGPNGSVEHQDFDEENRTLEGSDENRDDARAEKGKEEDGPPAPVGFWDHKLKHVRLEAMRKWVYTSTLRVTGSLDER